MADIAADGATAWFGAYLPSALTLGDPGGRDAALHAVQACIPHRVLLPIAVERIECGVLPAGRALVVRARERSCDGDTFIYDLTIGEPGGSVLERWTGLRLRAVTPAPLPATWPEPLLANFLERRLAELLPGAGLRVAAEAGAAGEHSGTDHAIQLSLAGAARIHRRPDGKPVIAATDAPAVSAANGGAMILAVTGRGMLACDVEPVASLPDDQWCALLGAERSRLAATVAGEAREAPDTARTRIWAAIECLKKAGLPLQTPMSLGSVQPDGWILLTAGAASVATFVTTTRSSQVPVAIAMLSGSVHAGV